MSDEAELIERLSNEADQCRNDGANDIADLLDWAHLRLAQLAAAELRARTAELALGDAARELPQVAGTVAHRIQVYRQSYSDQIAALRADAERLDYIESAGDPVWKTYDTAKCSACGNFHSVGGKPLWTTEYLNGRSFETVRAAIDAAREAKL